MEATLGISLYSYHYPTSKNAMSFLLKKGDSSGLVLGSHAEALDSISSTMGDKR
jgi:hypothetical protein